MQINLLPFSPLSENFTLSLYTEKAEDSRPYTFYADECPELWKQHTELAEQKEMYFTFDNNTADLKGQEYKATINLYNAPRIAKHYFRHLLFNHFSSRAAAVGIDFVGNLEVWIKDSTQPNTQITQYLKFSLVPQYKNMSAGFELLVAFNGYSETYNRSIAEIDTDQTQFKVIAGGKITKFARITPEQKNNITQIFPVINRFIAPHFGIKPTYRRPEQNKYISTYNKIADFFRNYLFVKEFDVFHFSNTNFITVPQEKILNVTDNSNVLMFGSNKTDLVPYNGIKNYGPFLPAPKNDIKFFFIAHQSDKKVCMHLYNIFFKGKNTDETIKAEDESKHRKVFSTLAEFIKQPFNTVPGGSIFFDNYDTAITDIDKKLLELRSNNQNLFAIYVTPVHKDNKNSPYHSLYYQIKERLLEKNISSQVIYREQPQKQNFNFFIPNIYTAVLGKMGGIPWQLQNTNFKNDLIIGVGAFKSEQIGKRYIGSAFCFNKDGVFQDFDCYRDNDLNTLVANIRRAIGHFWVDNQNIDRLIIHYYKTMSKKDAEPIQKMLYTLGFKVPIIIVTINKTEESEVVVFDNCTDKMPISGTIIPIRNNEFLLYNNSKYKPTDNEKILFPVKVKLEKFNADTQKGTLTENEITDMLNRVYQFSRMYWKAVKQQNLPITIKYPEMVAEIVPHFSDAELPEFGKKNLWFL